MIDSYLVDRSTNRAEKIDLPHGLNAFSGNPNEFAPQSDRVIISHEASNQPGDLWVYNLAHPPCRPTDFYRDCQPARDPASALSDCPLQKFRRKNHHGFALGAVQSEARRE